MFQHHQPKPYSAMQIILSLKFDLELCGRDLGIITKAISRHCTRGMHGNKMICLFIVTNETVLDVGQRLHGTLSNSNSVENFWIEMAPKPDDIFGQHGQLDPAVCRCRDAWVKAWDLNKPNDMREAQRRNARFKQRS
jgi:hypothetical protein